MSDLTVIILTRNEELNIQKCINTIRSVAKKIIVIDSFSVDRTVEIAKTMGAEVVQHSFKDHATQFNWAIENIKFSTSWVMKLDADEELTPELEKEIEGKLDSLPSSINGVILRRRVYFMGRWLRHGGMYPGLLLRIFRVGHGMSEMKSMDEHLIITDGEVVTFDNDFCDNNNKSLEWWINKHNWYSNKEVYDRQMHRDYVNIEKTDLHKQAKRRRQLKDYGYYRLPKFFRAHLYFIYRYWFRLGFLDGVEGKIFTFLQAYWYRYLIDAKMYECEKTRKNMPEQGELN